MLRKLRSGLDSLRGSRGFLEQVAATLAATAILAVVATLGSAIWWIAAPDNRAWLAETILAPVVVQMSSPISAPTWSLLAYGLLLASAIAALLVLVRRRVVRLVSAAERLREDKATLTEDKATLTEDKERQRTEITSAHDAVERLTRQRDDIARRLLPRGTKVDDARLRRLIEDPPETVGGWVEVGPCAFSVERIPYGNAPDRFEADGPFCAACKIRLIAEGSYGVHRYTCITPKCRLAAKSLESKEIKGLRERAESMVEAAYKAVLREGGRANLDPHMSLIPPGAQATDAAGEDPADAAQP